MFTDETLQSIRGLDPELADYEELPFTTYLPPWRSWRTYSYDFLLRFSLSVLEMGRRLMETEWDYPRNTAEEIALWSILCETQVAAEMEGHDFEPEALIALMFEDADFLAFYSEIPEDEMRKLAAVHEVKLEPEDWFTPFRPDRPVHPYQTG